MYSKYSIYYFLSLSCLIHAVVLSFLPGPDFSSELGPVTYQVVSVVPFDDNALTAFNANEFEEHVDWLETLDKVNREDILTNDRQETASQRFILPPTHFEKLDEAYEETIIEPILADSMALTDDKLDLLPSAMAELPIDLDWQIPQDGQWLSTPEDKSDQKIASPSTELLTENKTSDQDQIKGPVASRSVMFKPDLPVVSIDASTVITLKFWVFADGTVGKIVPHKKADAELERVAINYLKQWRFTALPKEGPQDDQWGIIPIKFLVY